MREKIPFIAMLIILTAAVGVFGQSATAANWSDWAVADIDITPNITYSTASGTELKLDLYLPKNREKPVPVMMLFHGGGWVDGQKERNVLQLLPYLSMGWAVVNVEYRMAKTAPAPAAVEDCRCALRWIFYRSSQYSFDTTKIVLTGGSAGGHLALITGLLPAGNPFDRSCPTAPETRWSEGTEPKMKVAAIVNFYGITDVADLLDGPNAKHYAIEWFGSNPNRIELAKQLSPLSYVTKDAPPIITIHGDRDNIVPYSHAVRLHEALEKAGVSHRLFTMKGAGHGGFNREQISESFVQIREFLTLQKIIEK